MNLTLIYIFAQTNSMLEASWVDFGIILGLKLSAKWTNKSILEGKSEKLDFLVFAEVKIKKSSFRRSENHDKSMQRALKNRYKIQHPLSANFC